MHWRAHHILPSSRSFLSLLNYGHKIVLTPGVCHSVFRSNTSGYKAREDPVEYLAGCDGRGQEKVEGEICGEKVFAKTHLPTGKTLVSHIK